MHNLDTALNFDINQPDNSHAFFRGEFATFQTNTKLIYVCILFPPEFDLITQLTHSVEVFAAHPMPVHLHYRHYQRVNVVTISTLL
jgi:hypothetical protein